MDWLTLTRRALALDLAHDGRLSLPSEGATGAAVLLLLGADSRGERSLLVTRRAEDLPHHPGQMAFPGGVCDPEDRDCVATALRESREEIGLAPEHVEVLGQLPTLVTGTGFQVVPVVGALRAPIEAIRLEPSPAEIAEVLWARLADLRAPGCHRVETIEREGFRYSTHVYPVGPHRVWGATGAMIKNLLDRMDRIEGRIADETSA